MGSCPRYQIQPGDDIIPDAGEVEEAHGPGQLCLEERADARVESNLEVALQMERRRSS